VFIIILVDVYGDTRFQFSNTDKLITYAKGKGGATFLHEMFLHEGVCVRATQRLP
jgi:hypothetical protein